MAFIQGSPKRRKIEKREKSRQAKMSFVSEELQYFKSSRTKSTSSDVKKQLQRRSKGSKDRFLTGGGHYVDILKIEEN